MKANELMIGDYIFVKPNGMPIKVAAVHHKKVAYHAVINKLTWVRESLLEPIPLTLEILEKNGFEDWDGWSIYSPENTGIEIAWLGTILKIGGECGNFELPAIEYIHQLQHALRLCGIDKTIEL